MWHSYLAVWQEMTAFDFSKVRGPKKILETGGIDPPTSHMLSERSTIWATSPTVWNVSNSERVYQHIAGGIYIWRSLPANHNYLCVVQHTTYLTFDSSVGRAVDCSRTLDIHRSLVRLRLEGLFYKFISSTFLLLKTYKSKINSLFQSLECKVAFVYERSNLYLKKN